MSTSAPIRIHVKPYNGKDPRRISEHRAAIEAAGRLEHYLNARRNYEHQILDYDDIARDTSVERKTVYHLLAANRGGEKGYTLPPLPEKREPCR